MRGSHFRNQTSISASNICQSRHNSLSTEGIIYVRNKWGQVMFRLLILSVHLPTTSEND